MPSQQAKSFSKSIAQSKGKNKHNSKPKISKKLNQKLTHSENNGKVEKEHHLSVVSNLESQLTRLEEENNKLKNILKNSGKTLPPESSITRCTTCKTSKIVEDLKRAFAKELKEKNRKWQQQKIDYERKLLREHKEKEKKLNTQMSKREQEIAGIHRRNAEKLEKARQLRKEEQNKLTKLQTKMSNVIGKANKIEQGDLELKRKLKAVTERTSASEIIHKNDLKRKDEKIKEMDAYQKKLQQQLRKAKQEMKKHSELKEQWKQKEANHLGELKELKREHRENIRKRIEQEKIELNRAKKVTNSIAGELEESNSKAEQMLIELQKLKKELEEKEEGFLSERLKCEQLENEKLDFEKQWEEKEKKVEMDFELLFEEKTKALNLENQREIDMIIEDYKKEFATTEEEHQAALQREREKFENTFQQLEKSHQEVYRQEKSCYERKVQDLTSDMEKKQELIQTDFNKQLIESQKLYDNVIAERKEFHSKYESQMKLIKEEHEEKMVQMNVTMERDLKEQETTFQESLKQKEKEYQKNMNEMNVISEDKLTHLRKKMDERIKELNSQHQCALEKVISENTLNESRLNAQIENNRHEWTLKQKQSDELINKLNQKLIQMNTETESLNKKYMDKINFLNKKLSLQFLLAKIHFDTAKKVWDKDLSDCKQLLDISHATLEKEKFLKEEKCKELQAIQQTREKEKNEAEFEIKRITELHREKILKIECEREAERKQSLEKSMAENANQKEIRAYQKKLTEEIEVLKAERIRLIDEHGKTIQEIKEKSEKEALQQKREIMNLENENESLSNEVERAKRQLANEQKGVFELARMSKDQEEKDRQQIKELKEKVEKLRTRETEARQMQAALEERYDSDLNMEIDNFKRQFAKERKELSKQHNDLGKKFELREKQQKVELMKMAEKIQKERRDLQKVQKSNHLELAKLKEKVLKEYSKDLEKEKKRLRLEIESDIEERFRKEYHAKMSWKQNKMEKCSLLSKVVSQEVSRLQKHLPIALKPTDKEGVYTFGARKISLVVVDGRLSVRIGGGYLTFLDFVNKFGESEANKLKKAVIEKNGKENSGKKILSLTKSLKSGKENSGKRILSLSKSLNRIDKKQKHRMSAFDATVPLSNRTNLSLSKKRSNNRRKRLSFRKGEMRKGETL